ncbi:MAG: hypothetical protein HY432_03630 [Candidatus Liptonbacteria bacterium]|nr:hypothetical protein [Candidatus Liptonbacteria bacterium]
MNKKTFNETIKIRDVLLAIGVLIFISPTLAEAAICPSVSISAGQFTWAGTAAGCSSAVQTAPSTLSGGYYDVQNGASGIYGYWRASCDASGNWQDSGIKSCNTQSCVPNGTTYYWPSGSTDMCSATINVTNNVGTARTVYNTNSNFTSTSNATWDCTGTTNNTSNGGAWQGPRDASCVARPPTASWNPSSYSPIPYGGSFNWSWGSTGTSGGYCNLTAPSSSPDYAEPGVNLLGAPTSFSGTTGQPWTLNHVGTFYRDLVCYSSAGAPSNSARISWTIQPPPAPTATFTPTTYAVPPGGYIPAGAISYTSTNATRCAITDPNAAPGDTSATWDPAALSWINPVALGPYTTGWSRRLTCYNSVGASASSIFNLVIAPPAASIKANGLSSITNIDPIETINIAWNSTSTDSWSSIITAAGCADTSLNTPVGGASWIANAGSGTGRYVGYPFRNCNIGINYTANDSISNTSVQSLVNFFVSSRIPTTGKVVAAGEQVRLRWNAMNATSCTRTNTYNPSTNVFNGSTSPTPSPYASTSFAAANVSTSTDYRFTLTCTNSAGVSSAASVGLTVNPAAPETCVSTAGNSCTRTNSCGSRTNSGTIQCNGTCNATAPSESGCTTSTSTTSTSTTSTSTTSTSPVCIFSANPSTIIPPQSSSLELTCINANSCSIDNGVGSVSPINDSEPVSPAQTTTYTLSCTGDNNVASSFQTTVRVTDYDIKEIGP